MHRPLPYRPEIDGLRAFAVLSVLAYHLNPQWLPGGYLGVDVFFVISGFLITSIIVKDCAVGEFSLKEFYWRRAHRILPSMLVVTALTCAAAYFILFPVELRSAAKACQRALLFSSNYFFARESGYFDPGTESNPFLHTWSLGVEEQFYFIFPLLAMLALRPGWLKARYVGMAVFVGLAVSFFMTRNQPTRAFFALESRAWELAAGTWLAVATSRGTLLRVMEHKAAAPFSLVLLFIVLFLPRGDVAQTPMAALAVLGAIMFIGSRAGAEDTPWHRVFAATPMRCMGRISYSLYLVHWPLIVFTRAWYGELRPAQLALLAVISFLLAVALHYTIERPLRKRRNPVAFLSTLAGVTAVILGCAHFCVTQKGELNPSMRATLDAILPELQGKREVHPRKTIPYRIGKTEAEPSMGLWGDSHAMAMVSALDDELKKRGLCCEVWVQGGNLPGPGFGAKDRKHVITDDVITALSRPAIRQVIVAARWSLYLKGHLKGEPNGDGKSPVIAGAETPQQARMIMTRALGEAFARLQRPDRKIAIVYPVPEVGVDVPYLMVRNLRTQKGVMDLTLRKPAWEYAARQDLAFTMLDEMCGKYGLLPIYPDRLLIRNGSLQISQGKRALYRDDDHLSRLGTEPLVQEILSRFQ